MGVPSSGPRLSPDSRGVDRAHRDEDMGELLRQLIPPQPTLRAWRQGSRPMRALVLAGLPLVVACAGTGSTSPDPSNCVGIPIAVDSRSRQLVALGNPAPLTTGQAYGIAGNFVVGDGSFSSGFYGGFRLNRQTGSLVPLNPLPGDLGTQVTAVNAQGVATGFSVGSNGMSTQSVVWRGTSVPDEAPGSGTSLVAIDDLAPRWGPVCSTVPWRTPLSGSKGNCSVTSGPWAPPPIRALPTESAPTGSSSGLRSLARSPRKHLFGRRSGGWSGWGNSTVRTVLARSRSTIAAWWLVTRPPLGHALPALGAATRTGHYRPAGPSRRHGYLRRRD